MSDENFTEAKNLLKELNDIKDTLKNLPRNLIKKFVKDNLQDDVEEILELFEKEVQPMPKNDPVKIEIINLLLYLGIDPYDSVNVEKIIKEIDLLTDNHTF